MARYNMRTYPVTGIAAASTDVVYTFVNYLLNKLPKNTIKQENIFVDQKSFITDQTKNRDGASGFQVVRGPKWLVRSNGLTDPFSREDDGPNVKVLNMIPGLINDRHLDSNHRLRLFEDPEYGIILDTIELRRKMKLNFQFKFNTIDDVETFKSIIYNKWPVGAYQKVNNMKFHIFMPSQLIADVIRLAFKDGIFDYNNIEHYEILSHYLNKFGYFNMYHFQELNNEKIWYLLEREFNMYYYLKMEEDFGGVTADKRDQVYDGFDFEMTVDMSLKIPNSYILNYNTMNIPNQSSIDNIFLTNYASANISNRLIDSDALDYVQGGIQDQEVDDRKFVPPIYGKTGLAIIKEDLIMTNSTEIFSVINYFGRDSKYAILIEYSTIEEQKEMFFFRVYEEGYILEDDAVEADFQGNDIILSVYKCNTQKQYTLYIYLNQEKVGFYFKRIEERFNNEIKPNGEINFPEGNLGNELSNTPVIGGKTMRGGLSNGSNFQTKSTIDTFKANIFGLRG